MNTHIVLNVVMEMLFYLTEGHIIIVLTVVQRWMEEKIAKLEKTIKTIKQI